MAEGEDNLGIEWSARLELGDLEADAEKAQQIIDQLFERYVSKTIDVRINTDTSGAAAPASDLPPRREDLIPPFMRQQFDPQPIQAETGAASAPAPGIVPQGEVSPMKLRVDTSELDIAQAKVQQLIALMASANQGVTALAGNADLAPTQPLSPPSTEVVPSIARRTGSGIAKLSGGFRGVDAADREWLAQSMEDAGTPSDKLAFLDTEIQERRRNQSAFEPGQRGHEDYGRDIDALQRMRDRVAGGKEPLSAPGTGEPPLPANSPQGWGYFPGYEPGETPRSSDGGGMGEPPLQAPRLTPSATAEVFGPALGPDEELQLRRGGGSPPLEPPSSRGLSFGDEPNTGFVSRFSSRGTGSPGIRPETPQEAAGMRRGDLFAPLPEATVIGDENEGGEGDEAGRGRGSRSFLGRGFARRFTGGFLLYEGLRVAEGFQRYGRESALAGNDPLGQLNAEQTFEQTVSGVPLIGQAADLIANSIAESQGFGRFDTELAIRRAKVTDAQTDLLTHVGEGDIQSRRRADIGLAVDPSERARREAQATFDTANEARLRERREVEAKAVEDRRLADIAVEQSVKEAEKDNAAGRTEAIDSPTLGDFGRAEGLASNLGTYNQAIAAARHSYEQAIAPDQSVLDRALSDINFGRQQEVDEFRTGTESLRGQATGLPARDVERTRLRSTQSLQRRALERKADLAAPGSVEFQELDETLSDTLDRQAAERDAAERRYVLEDRNATFNADTATGSLPFVASGDTAGLRRFNVGRSAFQGVQNAISSGGSFSEIIAAVRTGGAAIVGNALGNNLDVGRASLSLSGESDVLAAELARDPLGAITARIEAERVQATEAARNRGVLTDDVQRKIDRKAADQTALGTRQFNEHADDLTAEISGRRGQVDALLRRDETGAEAIGIATETKLQAEQLFRGGFRQQGTDAVALGRDRLRLERQQFLDRFRGTEVTSLDAIDFGGPRNTVDVDARLEEISASSKGLDDVLKKYNGLASGPFGSADGQSGAGANVGTDPNKLIGVNVETFFQKMQAAFSAAMADVVRR